MAHRFQIRLRFKANLERMRRGIGCHPLKLWSEPRDRTRRTRMRSGPSHERSATAAEPPPPWAPFVSTERCAVEGKPWMDRYTV